MKLSNFASLDPFHKNRGVKGLSNAGKGEVAIWHEFHANWEEMAFQSQMAVEKSRASLSKPIQEHDFQLPQGETEITREVRVRKVQAFFRDAVLAIYRKSCAICDIKNNALLIASHIIPWRAEVNRRADPRNGLLLCALHDRAFDKGLITVSIDHLVVISKSAGFDASNSIIAAAFFQFENKPIRMPDRFAPASDSLEWHRVNVFNKS